MARLLVRQGVGQTQQQLADVGAQVRPVGAHVLQMAKAASGLLQPRKQGGVHPSSHPSGLHRAGHPAEASALKKTPREHHFFGPFQQVLDCQVPGPICRAPCKVAIMILNFMLVSDFNLPKTLGTSNWLASFGFPFELKRQVPF